MVLNITKMDTNQPENDRSRSHGDFQRLVTLQFEKIKCSDTIKTITIFL